MEEKKARGVSVTAAIELSVKIDGSGYGFDTDDVAERNSRLTFTNDAEVYVHLISRF
jgi:hypothetical protein